MTQQRAADYPLDYSKGPGEAGKDRLQDLANTATDQLHNVSENAQEMASKVVEQAREYGDKAQQAVASFKPYVQNSMKEQPMATLAVASIIGFALGALWKK
jgi:ElaB/YqjD/DUF883 family membrane-anchored ribosome-binding protein